MQLTHANMTSQARNLPFDLAPGDRALTILPVWHSYERVFEMVAISMGVCTYYTNLRSIGEDLKTVRPTVMASAPRLWENLYQKLMARIDEAPSLRRKLFHAARFCTCRVKRAERFFLGQELDIGGRGPVESFLRATGHLSRWITLMLPYRVLDKIVLAKLREAVGCSEFRGTISGGGALQPHVDEFFNFIGIPVLEGYGLTESSPVLAVRTWKNLVIGTVGPFYPETEIRIVDLESGRVLYPDRSRRDQGRGRQRRNSCTRSPDHEGLLQGSRRDFSRASRWMAEDRRYRDGHVQRLLEDCRSLQRHHRAAQRRKRGTAPHRVQARSFSAWLIIA